MDHASAGKMSQRRILVATASAVVAITVLAIVIWSLRAGGAAPERMALPDYMDERTGEFSQHGINEFPPLQGKDGEDSVVRVMWVDGYYGAPAADKIKYLFKYAPDAKTALTEAMRNVLPANRQAIIEHMTDEMSVRLPKAGSPWVRYNSPEGQAITR